MSGKIWYRLSNKKNIQEGHLFITEKGLYSEDRYVPELEIIMKKYPNVILTLNSAFYYYGLTDTIPDHYYVATPKSNRKIEDVRVKQIYENSNAFEMGKTTIEYDDEGASLLINSNEQMLSEKLWSLLKFGTFSTRFKDIYELCFTV